MHVSTGDFGTGGNNFPKREPSKSTRVRALTSGERLVGGKLTGVGKNKRPTMEDASMKTESDSAWM